MPPSADHTLQSVILKLQEFWADQGCLIWQPYHTEVGAGTMNPATLLRVLGPEPWWVAYVEPSFRPADGRYGENPNRWQHYYQFQVILKPDPGDPQERYLQSLIALGVDPARHDIRFVEDNWEAPTVGAWGLGWEVWLDGQEITQYTYFQQAGGQALDPVSVEITYGLERILLALQGVDTFLDLQWDDHLSYGDIKLRSEIEYCTYNFELADVDRLWSLYESYEAEAGRTIEAGLVQPAYDYVLKCSHVFNLLDARGAVGVTERAALFARMRELAQKVAIGYGEQRQEAEYPLLGEWAQPKAEPPKSDDGEMPTEHADFLLEVGVEEMPAADLSAVLAQLREAVPEMLRVHRIEHGEVSIQGTPRRLVVIIEDLAPSQSEQVTVVKGPPAERAFDETGAPTEAAHGFARSKGVAAQDLEVEEIDGGRYVVASVRKEGQRTAEVLAAALPELLATLTFKRTMRWNETGVGFSRPIRWLLGLHGEAVVPFEFAGIRAGRHSQGLRFEDPTWVEMREAGTYLAEVAERGILIDPAQRRERILEGLRSLAQEVDGEVVEDAELLAEVANLIEVPTAFRGDFDSEYLELPRAVLITVMREHQRYFAVERDGQLLPYFLAVRNGGPDHLETVRVGNEQVIRARFADAAFFFERDRGKPLDEYLPELTTRTFESSLGSMRAKIERIERLVALLAAPLSLGEAERATALRAAHLSKADLATEMVVEMTSLQGEMGRIYALESGEPAEVARAIADHYLPRGAGDELPGSRAGMAVGLADRLDSLMGLFAAGLEPSGAGDPFALRRTAIGLLEILIRGQEDFDLAWALAQAAEGLPLEASEERREACLAFVRRRLQGWLLSEGHRHDAVKAVLAEQAHNPARAVNAVQELESWIGREDWSALLDNYARCVRITRGLKERLELQPQLLREEAAVALHAALESARGEQRRPGSVDDVLAAFQPLIGPIEAFFDEVLVMAEDEELRTNRLALLQRIAEMPAGVVDLSALEGF